MIVSGTDHISFGIDSDGNYGYKKVGADTVTPFKTGGGALKEITRSVGWVAWSGYDGQVVERSCSYTVEKDNMYIIAYTQALGDSGGNGAGLYFDDWHGHIKINGEIRYSVPIWSAYASNYMFFGYLNKGDVVYVYSKGKSVANYGIIGTYIWTIE